MRTKNLLKLAFTMLAMIVMTGAMAQTPAQYTATESETMVQTEGISFRLYVQPDPVYSPNYDADGTLGANSLWTFTIPTGLTGSVASGTPVDQNWVEISNPVASATNYDVTAQETNSTLSCTNPGRTTSISVIAAPTAVIAPDDVTGWTAGAGTNEYYRCAAVADAIAVPQLNITFTEDARRVANAYDYILSVTKAGYDINDNLLVAESVVTADFGKAAMQAIADYDASPVAHTTASTLTILDDGSGNLVRTKYVFTLENISSKTSYLSYFRANTGFTPTIAANYYAVANQTVTLWLNPAPVTGPIYHIPNDFSAF